MVRNYGKFEVTTNETKLIETLSVFEDDQIIDIVRRGAKARKHLRYIEDAVLDEIAKSLMNFPAMRQYRDFKPERITYALETNQGRTSFYFGLRICDKDPDVYHFTLDGVSVYQDGLLILDIPDYVYNDTCLKSSLEFLKQKG